MNNTTVLVRCCFSLSLLLSTNVKACAVHFQQLILSPVCIPPVLSFLRLIPAQNIRHNHHDHHNQIAINHTIPHKTQMYICYVTYFFLFFKTLRQHILLLLLYVTLFVGSLLCTALLNQGSPLKIIVQKINNSIENELSFMARKYKAVYLRL